MEKLSYAELTEGIGVLLDGMTIQNAFDLLFETENPDEPLAAPLIAVQLLSLAHFVDALVSYDYVATLPHKNQAWPRSSTLKELKEEGVIRELDLPRDLSESVEEYTEQAVESAISNHSFHYFADVVTRMSPEAVALRVARHYHDWQSSSARYLRRHMALGLQAEEDGGTDHLAGKSELIAASRLFASGAIFYRAISGYYGLPYICFCLRAPFCFFEDARRSLGVVAASEVAMDLLQGMIAARLKDRLDPTDIALFDMRLPPLLGYVLEKASHKSDIVPLTLELRRSDAGRTYRRGLAPLSSAILRGDVPNILKQVDRLEGTIQQSFGQQGDSSSASVILGVAGMKLNIPVKSPTTLLRKAGLAGRQTTLYHLLLREFPTIWRMRRDLMRLFQLDQSTAHSLDRYLEVLSTKSSGT